jgi:hypothetical protein
VIDRLLKNQNPLENRNNLRSTCLWVNLRGPRHNFAVRKIALRDPVRSPGEQNTEMVCPEPGTGDVSVEAANQPVTRLSGVLGGGNGPSTAASASVLEPNTDRSGRGSLSYTNSNRKIPARRSSVGRVRQLRALICTG